MKICFVFPSRSRPIKFFKSLNNIREMSESDNYFIIAKLDEDDESVNTNPIREKLKKDYPEVTVKWGISYNKVHAINRSMEDLPECDILIIMSDDIVWDVNGFDNEIRQAFKEHFPNLDGTVHFPDDHGKERTIIVSILGINLYKRFGYLYHPDYANLFCDNEFTDVTKQLNKYVFVNKRLFTHNHPIWTKKDWDDLYRANENPETYKRDREVYLKRKSNNFGI